MDTYTIKMRLEKPEIPNLFKYAKKELSQDAILCWILEWRNVYGNSMNEVAYLLLVNFIENSIYKGDKSLFDITSLEILTQYKNIDILVLAKLRDGRTLPIIIEDKIDTSDHDNQLVRYRDTIIKEYTDFAEPICVYYKTGYIFEDYSEIEKHKYIVFNKEKVLQIFKPFEDSILPHLFCDYYVHLNNLHNREKSIINSYDEAILKGDIKILTDTLSIDYAQWELMKRLTKNIKHVDKGCYIRDKNRDGSPRTHFDIKPQFLESMDTVFFKIDKNSKGYYFSIRQYCEHKSPEFMQKAGYADSEDSYKIKRHNLDIYRSGFEVAVREVDSDIQMYKSNEIGNQSEIGTFYLDNIETLLFLQKNLPKIMERFFQLVKY